MSHLTGYRLSNTAGSPSCLSGEGVAAIVNCDAVKSIRRCAYRARRFVTGAVILICGAIAAPGAGLAQTPLTIDNNTTVTEAPGSVTHGSTIVGNISGTVGGVPGGTYNVPAGSTVTLVASPTFELFVGNNAGSTGVVNVNGGTITSTNLSSQYEIGYFGQGTLTVSNGGTVIGPGDTHVGDFAGSSGVLTVDGPGASFSSGAGSHLLSIGFDGTGQLNVTNGATVHAAGMQVGGGGGVGTALVSGAGSSVSADLFLGVGVNAGGVGTLTITDGGAVTSDLGTYLALSRGSTGNIALSNGGSLTSPLLAVGIGGTADLQIHSNSTATINGPTIVGALAGSGSIEVTGTGASLAVHNGDLNVGAGGDGAMTISGGGNVSVTGGSSFISGQCSGPGLSGVFCFTPAQGGHGVVTVTDPGSVLNAGNSLVVGQFGPGVLTIANSGLVSSPNGVTVAQNAGVAGTLNIGAAAGSAAAAPGTLNAPTVTFGTSNGLIVFNHTDTSGNYTFAPAISGPGAVMQISGTTVLTGANTYGGLTTVSGGTLQAGAAQRFSPFSDVNVESAGTLDLNGFNQQVNNVSNAGLINMGTGKPPGTILLLDNYVGQGGTIAMNTFLGDDTSASDHLLFLTGSASGQTFLRFTNVGGPGAQTTENGIPVVEFFTGSGTSTFDAFTLANPELRAGAYDYRLFKGPPIPCPPLPLPPAVTGRGAVLDACNSWFLRSTFIEQPPGPGEPEPPPVTPPGVLPPEPPTPGPGLFPIIGPEIATYGVVQPMAQQLGRTMLGTHDDRLGDLYPMPCEPTAPVYTKAPPVYTKAPTTDCADGWRPAVWGRLFGQQIDNHYRAFADPRTDGQIAGLQVGIDVVRSDSLIPGHKDYGGFYFAYGNANVDVSGLVTNAAATAYVLQHTGSANLNAYSGGAYWTHYGVSGWYADLTLQGTSYNGGASTEFAALKTTGAGFISSLEGGYPIALPQLGPGFVLEPQAQVLWQWVRFDAGHDGLGPVALGTTSTTTARVGLKGKWTVTTASGQVWQPYVRANYWSDFGGTAVMMFGPDDVPLVSHAQYMDVNAGFTARIDTHLSGFAEVGYQFAVSNEGGGKRDGVRGTTGLRYQW